MRQPLLCMCAVGARLAGFRGYLKYTADFYARVKWVSPDGRKLRVRLGSNCAAPARPVRTRKVPCTLGQRENTSPISALFYVCNLFRVGFMRLSGGGFFSEKDGKAEAVSFREGEFLCEISALFTAEGHISDGDYMA